MMDLTVTNHEEGADDSAALEKRKDDQPYGNGVPVLSDVSSECISRIGQEQTQHDAPLSNLCGISGLGSAVIPPKDRVALST